MFRLSMCGLFIYSVRSILPGASLINNKHSYISRWYVITTYDKCTGHVGLDVGFGIAYQDWY